MAISDIFKTTWSIGSENDTDRSKTEKISTAVFGDERTSTILINKINFRGTTLHTLNSIYFRIHVIHFVQYFALARIHVSKFYDTLEFMSRVRRQNLRVALFRSHRCLLSRLVVHVFHSSFSYVSTVFFKQGHLEM